MPSVISYTIVGNVSLSVLG